MQQRGTTESQLPPNVETLKVQITVILMHPHSAPMANP
jgi:hypothetical protein